MNQEQAFEVKPELLDPIFAPIPTIAETEFALNEEQDDAVPTWEDDLYAVLADDSDDDDFADNPYYVTQKIEDARLDKCHFNIVQFTAEQQVPKGPTVMTKTDLSDSFEELVQSLGESETKRQALTHENLIEIIVQRPTWGVAVPTVTRAANSDIGSILTDMFVVTLPSLHGYFGVDQLPEKNMASTDVMMGIAPEIKPHKEPKEPKEPKQKTPHPLRKSVTAEKLGKNLPIQAIVTSVVTEVASEIVEVINCICATPAIDDGLFMISCDKCTTWFHGHCVGITASVSEWTCTRHGSPSAPPT